MHSAVCKFCRQSYQVMLWDTKPRFPKHRTPGSPLIACDGSDELLEVAAAGTPAMPAVERFSKIPGRRGTNIEERIEQAAEAAKKGEKLDPELGYSKTPNFYDSRDERNGLD